MRVLASGVTLGVLLLVLGARAADLPLDQIHAGPVYTSGQQGGQYPRYPEIQVDVGLPASASQDVRKPENFLLQVEDRTPVQANQVTTLAATGYGVALVAAIDVSGSMKGGPLNAVRAGLSKFVSEAEPHDKVAVMTIADDGRWDVNWGDPVEKVKSSLEQLAVRGTRTRLWDGLLDAVGQYPETPLSRHLMVVSDGHDEGSKHTEQEVIDAARQHNVVIDAIGITRSDPKYLHSLESLALQTGGGFRAAKSTQQLQDLVGSGIQEVKAQPVVGFRLQDFTGDGKDHRLQVIWKRGEVESRAEVMALIPLVSSPSKKRWAWIGGGAGAILLTILAISLVLSRRPKPVAAANVPVSAAVQPVSAPSPRSGVSPVPPRPVAARTFGEQTPSPLMQPAKRAPAPVPALTPARSRTQLGVRFPMPVKGKPSAWLVCEEGFAPGASFPLDQSEFWIGALENNHLRMADDRTVSGNHACLVFDHEVLGIFDNGSTNGTLVNGELVSSTRRVLRPGDRIHIGNSTFVLKLTNPEVDRA